MLDKSHVCASLLGASLGYRDSLPDSTLRHPLPHKEASCHAGGEHDAIMGTARNLLKYFSKSEPVTNNNFQGKALLHPGQPETHRPTSSKALHTCHPPHLPINAPLVLLSPVPFYMLTVTGQVLCGSGSRTGASKSRQRETLEPKSCLGSRPGQKGD